MKAQELKQLIREEVRKTLKEGRLLAAITPKPRGEFKASAMALEKYLDSIGAQYDAEELAYLVIDIKDAGAQEGYDGGY
jgi:hypothetical protein